MTGLYVHIPFCQKKCFYCSFIVAVSQKHHRDSYVHCLAKEMKFYPPINPADVRARLHKKYFFDSIYFGGGTPSQLNAKQFSFLIDSIKKSFVISDGAEITVEMNPEDVNIEKLQCYRDNGVNRLSLGVQTFQDDYLKFLGRCHNSRQASEAYELMRSLEFDNVSIDLMYGFPDQSLNDIQKDLEALRGINSEHVSLYSLTIEEGSKFFVHGVPLPGQEKMAEQYLFVRERLIGMGFEHYEVSNFAKPGKRSVHNINYWQGGNYIGLGVGGHSHLDGKRWWNVSKVREYIQRIESGVSAEDGREELSPKQRLSEALVFGLRMEEGVDLEVLQKKFGKLSGERKKIIKNFLNDGFLELKGDKIKTTFQGLLVLDVISEKLI